MKRMKLVAVFMLSIGLAAQAQMAGTFPHEYLGEYPAGGKAGWAGLWQGITHDGDNWFVANQNTIWKLPAHRSLDYKLAAPNAELGIYKANIPVFLADLGYDQLGALEYHGGYVLVPLKDRDGQAKPAKILAFRASDLQFAGVQNLDARRESADWCAVNSYNGRLYTSREADYGLQAYRITFRDGGFELERDRRRDIMFSYRGKLYQRIEHIRGGVFSAQSGNLYLASGAHVVVVQSASGKILGRFSATEGLQGITLWDLDENERVPAMDGQLHLLRADGEEGGIFLHHYRLPVESQIVE